MTPFTLLVKQFVMSFPVEKHFILRHYNLRHQLIKPFTDYDEGRFYSLINDPNDKTNKLVYYYVKMIYYTRTVS